MIERRGMRCKGHVARMAEMKNECKCFVGKGEGKKSLERRRQRLENNIKIELTKIGREGVGRIHLAQDSVQWRALVNAALSLRNTT
jgi:hypothetical protein